MEWGTCHAISLWHPISHEQPVTCHLLPELFKIAPKSDLAHHDSALRRAKLLMADKWALHDACFAGLTRRKSTTSIQAVKALSGRICHAAWASLTVANTGAQTDFCSLCHMRDLMA